VLKKYDDETKERLCQLTSIMLSSLLFPLGYAGFAFASHGPVQSNMV
jgi:hypothetical protein